MSDSVRAFIPRAPRYVLRPDDNQMIRYALPNEKNNPYITKFIDISQSGLAFVISQRALRDGFPHVGESLKIEVPVPGGEQFAWWAKVTRIQEYENPWKRFDSDGFWNETVVLVAVVFENLPDGHAAALKTGLSKKFEEIAIEKAKYRRKEIIEWWGLNWRSILLYTLMTLMTFALLFWLSEPTANYDAHRGSPWGERYKF